MNRGAQMLWGLKIAQIIKLVPCQKIKKTSDCLLFLVLDNMKQVQLSLSSNTGLITSAGLQ